MVLTHLAAPFNGKCGCGAAGVFFLVDGFCANGACFGSWNRWNGLDPRQLEDPNELVLHDSIAPNQASFGTCFQILLFEIWFLGFQRQKHRGAAAPVQSCTVWTSSLRRAWPISSFGLENPWNFVARRSPHWFGGPFWSKNPWMADWPWCSLASYCHSHVVKGHAFYPSNVGPPFDS